MLNVVGNLRDKIILEVKKMLIYIKYLNGLYLYIRKEMKIIIRKFIVVM